VALTEGMVFSA